MSARRKESPVTKKPTHLVTADDFANPEEAAEWLAGPPAAPAILDRFSDEQRIQIRRLMSAGDFKGTTPAEATDETIATLAAAALFVFGLDSLARGAFDQVSSVVYGDGSADEYLINVVINEDAGEKWTLRQRAAEREAALKGRGTVHAAA